MKAFCIEGIERSSHVHLIMLTTGEKYSHRFAYWEAIQKCAITLYVLCALDGTSLGRKYVSRAD